MGVQSGIVETEKALVRLKEIMPCLAVFPD